MRLTTITSVLLSVGVASWEVVATASADMPKVLAGVYIGISHAQLTAVRPSVEKFELLGEQEQNDALQLFDETIHDAPFSWYVSYGLVNGKLCMVRLSDDGQRQSFDSRRAKVLQGAIRKWGNDYRRLVYREPIGQRGQGIGSSAGPLAALQWRRGDMEILLVYSATLKAQTPSARTNRGDERAKQLGISIFTKQCLPDSVRKEMLAGLGPARGHDRREMFRDLKRKADPPLFE